MMLLSPLSTALANSDATPSGSPESVGVGEDGPVTFELPEPGVETTGEV